MSAWWADVSTIQEARKAGMQGVWAAGIIAVITAIFVIAGPQLGLQASFIDAAIFAVIAAGIATMSRTAAVVGLVLYAAETLYKFSTIGFKGIPVTIVLMLGFINSVRGTFAFHSFDGTPAGTATMTRGPIQRVKPAPKSTVAIVAAGIGIVVVGIAVVFGLMAKFEKESKGTAQLGKLPPVKVADDVPPISQAIVMPAPKTAASLETPKTDSAAEARKKQEEDARLAAEPQIYLEPEWNMYHVAGCKAVKPGMRPIAIELRPISYQPHTCVPDDLKRWTRKLRD